MSRGLCQCGCGQPTPIAPRTDTRKGWSKGQPMRFVAGHGSRTTLPSPNPSGLCMCGCGQMTAISTATRKERGDVRGHHMRCVRGHSPQTETPPYLVEDRGYETPCWVWQRGRTGNGYGQETARRLAHRVYYESLVGPIPKGMQLDHLCRVRHCVNPAHLEPVTNAVNSRRGARAKLTPEAVRVIRRLPALGWSHREIARVFGVGKTTVGCALSSETWSV